MSFYVNLPSNLSTDIFSSNTMTDFSVQLKEPIRLFILYEVALVELTYHAWSLLVGKLLIDVKDNNQYNVFNVIFHDGESIGSFVNRLN